MNTIQEQIAAFYREADPSIELAQEILKSLRGQEVLAAFFPQTKHYYLVRELGQVSALLFSDEDCFERFAERCKERGEFVQAIRVAPEMQAQLYADLWRCGCMRVIVDFLPRSINFHIYDFMEQIPEDRDKPLAQRVVLAPALLGRLLLMQQAIATRTATGTETTALLTELYHSPLHVPVMVINTGEVSGKWIPPIERDGKRLLPAFTDMIEMQKAELPGGNPLPVWFSTLRQQLSNGYDAMILNPGSGAELVLDLSLLEAAEKAATGQMQDFTLRTMREVGEKITVTEPDALPEGLLDSLNASLQNEKQVAAAWLRLLKKEDSLLPSYLVIVDCGEEQVPKELARSIADAVRPFSEGRSMELVSYHCELGMLWTGSTAPIYKRRRLGLFRK